MFLGDGLEVRRGGIGPRQQIIDAGVEMASGDAVEHVSRANLGRRAKGTRLRGDAVSPQRP